MRRIGIAALLVLIVAPAHAQREAEGLSASIRGATAKVSPAVVSVRPVGIVPRVGVVPPIVVPPFFRPGRIPIPGARVEHLPSGSGVVVDAKRGLVATTGQVLRGVQQAEVVLPDGSIRPALRITTAAPNTDLVFIEIDPKGAPLQAIDWAGSSRYQLGDHVVAVGRSAMGRLLASAGIVSAEVDQEEAGSELEPIQTDAQVTSETAGGPLVNLDGQVVGISQAPGDFVGGDPRDGFRTAIPASVVKKAVDDFRADGKVRHGYLGVTLGSGRRPEGTTVTSVAEGSPAAGAGLMPGDRIVSVDGRRVRDAQALSRAVEMTPVGQEMTLVIDRQGKKFESKVRTQPRPDVFGPPTIDPRPSAEPSLDPLEEPEPKTIRAPPEPDHPKSELPPALPEGPLTKLKPKAGTP